MNKPMNIILLLGSYDPQTKAHLDTVREEIVKKFSGEDVYSSLLDDLEIYSTRTIQVLVELFDKDKATLFIFHRGVLADVYDINLKNNLDETVYSFLKGKYEIQKFSKEPIYRKFNSLMRLAKALFLIRDREETRGGEYIELMHALSQGHSEKIWFFKRNGVRLSAMLMEYLDKFRVKIRPYTNQQDLITEAIRILTYELSSS